MEDRTVRYAPALRDLPPFQRLLSRQLGPDSKRGTASLLAVAFLLLSFSVAYGSDCSEPPLTVTVVAPCAHVSTSVQLQATGKDEDLPQGAEPPDCRPTDYSEDLTYGWSCDGSPATGSGKTFETQWSTPGAKTVTLTVDDAASRHRDGPLVRQIEVLVWDAVILVTPGEGGTGWLPAPSTSMSVQTVLTPSSIVSANFEYTMSDVSSLLGTCCNAGTDTEKDLKIPDQNGWNVALDRQSALSTAPGSASLISITAFDYGAYGKILCKVLPTCGASAMAHVGDTQTETLNLPMDADGNHIADAWAHNSVGENAGGMWDDLESTPTGGNAGDGFVRFDEYRGFMLSGTHVRTDPDGAKDVYIRDQNSLGIADFTAMNLTTHLIGDSEWDSSTRVVNCKGGLQPQHGMLMTDGGWHPDYMGEVSAVGTPNVCEWAKIYTARIRQLCGPTYDQTTWDPLDSEVKARTIGHELGHYVKIQHHTNGTTGCVLHEPCPTSSPVPHGYCTSSPGCASRSELH